MFHPQINLAQLLATPQPEVDTHYSEFVTSTEAFVAAIDAYVLNAKNEITRRKEEHTNYLKSQREIRARIESDTSETKSRAIELFNALEKERSESHELEGEVQTLRRQLTQISEKTNLVQAEMDEIRANVARLRHEKDKDRGVLDAQAAKSVPDLLVLEDRLGWAVEGVQKDMLLFRFTRIDESDWSREFSIVLDISERGYRVPTSTPLLPALPTLLETLNETREFYTFIKGVRAAFREYVEDERRGR